ncbi:MAG: hypothetical protein ABSD80_06335 [Caulobacteraceae bacterium]|jgi:hypothetical protein
MSRAKATQLNVRSAFARARTRELSRLTGMTATEIVEDALRGYVPPGAPAQTGRLVRRGRILVIPAGGSSVSLDEANAALDRVRERDLDR